MSIPKASVRRIDKVVAELLSQRGYAQAFVNEELRTVWNQIVGSQMGEISRPGRIRNGVLDVFVANSTANQELTFRRRELVEKLAKALPKHLISDLRVRVS